MQTLAWFPSIRAYVCWKLGQVAAEQTLGVTDRIRQPFIPLQSLVSIPDLTKLILIALW